MIRSDLYLQLDLDLVIHMVWPTGANNDNELSAQFFTLDQKSKNRTEYS